MAGPAGGGGGVVRPIWSMRRLRIVISARPRRNLRVVAREAPADAGRVDGSEEVVVHLVRDKGYRFVVDVGDGYPPLVMDEPAPVGTDTGPSPERVLAAAVGHCLTSSLLYCLERAHVAVDDLNADVRVRLERTEAGRLRVGGLAVTIHLGVGPEDHARLGRCLELFEDFCVVTASVRQGVEVTVDVDALRAPEGGDPGA